MVSARCKAVAEKELQALGIHYSTIELGEIKIKKPLTVKQEHELRINLLKQELELLDDKKAKLLEKIKNVIIELIHQIEDIPKTNYSDYISNKLQYDYTYLANLFSAVHRTTIEQCIIAHKIERAKELLVDNELTLTKLPANCITAVLATWQTSLKKLQALPLLILKNWRTRVVFRWKKFVDEVFIHTNRDDLYLLVCKSAISKIICISPTIGI